MDIGRGVSLLRGVYRFTMPREKCRKLTTLEMKILSSDVLAVAHFKYNNSIYIFQLIIKNINMKYPNIKK